MCCLLFVGCSLLVFVCCVFIVVVCLVLVVGCSLVVGGCWWLLVVCGLSFVGYCVSCGLLFAMCFSCALCVFPVLFVGWCFGVLPFVFCVYCVLLVVCGVFVCCVLLVCGLVIASLAFACDGLKK